MAFVPDTKKKVGETSLAIFLMVLVEHSFYQDSTHENR